MQCRTTRTWCWWLILGGTNCRFVLWRLDSETGNHEFLFQKVCMLAGAGT